MTAKSQVLPGGDGLRSALAEALQGEQITFVPAESRSSASLSSMPGVADASVGEIRALAQKLHDDLVANNAAFRAWLALNVALDALDAAWPGRSAGSGAKPVAGTQRAARRARTQGLTHAPPASAEQPRRTIAEAALTALKYRRRPMTTAELVEAMLADGAQHASASVSSTLSQNPQFRSLRWNGAKRWWPAQLRPPREPSRTGEAGLDDEG
ncbi:hypothetical protein ABEG18_06245 [Alsobacter sp. KACC 23698]|uniref:HTH HARE-type domain-containing protein n=1 Tax=Alsobacter sp. KACC 23698 TaxID=3149229 RepID=A0AAU7JJ95_9HYPH